MRLWNRYGCACFGSEVVPWSGVIVPGFGCGGPVSPCLGPVESRPSRSTAGAVSPWARASWARGVSSLSPVGSMATWARASWASRVLSLSPAGLVASVALWARAFPIGFLLDFYWCRPPKPCRLAPLASGTGSRKKGVQESETRRRVGNWSRKPRARESETTARGIGNRSVSRKSLAWSWRKPRLVLAETPPE